MGWCARPLNLSEFTTVGSLIPIVVVHGASDPGGARASTAASASLRLPSARAVLLEGCGRQCAEEAPALVAAQLEILASIAKAKFVPTSRGPTIAGDRSVGSDEVVDPDSYATF